MEKLTVDFSQYSLSENSEIQLDVEVKSYA